METVAISTRFSRHERLFAEGGAGFDYRIVVAFHPRGAFDRRVVRRAVERAARQTVDNLERRFALLAPKETA
jgi:hypothetical protein